MPQVSVTIDGKNYKMACDEGQEGHLIALADKFEQYVAHLKGAFGEIGDQRLTVMAAIMVVDELTELEQRFNAQEKELKALRGDRAMSVQTQSERETELVKTLLGVTEKIENMTKTIHRPPSVIVD